MGEGNSKNPAFFQGEIKLKSRNISLLITLKILLERESFIFQGMKIITFFISSGNHWNFPLNLFARVSYAARGSRNYIYWLVSLFANNKQCHHNKVNWQGNMVTLFTTVVLNWKQSTIITRHSWRLHHVMIMTMTTKNTNYTYLTQR